MPTDSTQSADGKPVAIILAAHQDDETGVLMQIHSHVKAGHRVVYACLTRGIGAENQVRRNAESTNVLTHLGVHVDDILFAGDLLEIDDLTLIDNMTAAGDWLSQWFDSLGEIEAVYTTAYEGGHPDHDTLHMLSAHLCEERGLLPKLKQYSLYNGYKMPWQLFRSLSPMDINGPVEAIRVPWLLRFYFLSFSLRYYSQWKTMVGLFPFWVLHYMCWGTQQLQAVTIERISDRPHEGTLYYEKRLFSTWEHFNNQRQRWLAER